MLRGASCVQNIAYAGQCSMAFEKYKRTRFCVHCPHVLIGVKWLSEGHCNAAMFQTLDCCRHERRSNPLDHPSDLLITTDVKRLTELNGQNYEKGSGSESGSKHTTVLR